MTRAMVILGIVLVALAVGLLVYMLNSEQRVKHYSQAPPQAVIGPDFQILTADRKPRLSDDDLIQYDLETHTMHLRPGVAKRFRTTSAHGTPFLVCAEGTICYQGVLTTVYSSRSQKTVTIVDGHERGTDRPTLELGYPAPAFFAGEDPRCDPRIRTALLRTGKLKEK